jgi:hypothetical protein
MLDGRLVSARWHNRYSVVYGEDQASYSFRDSNPARSFDTAYLGAWPSIFQPSAAFDVYLHEEFAPFINEAFFSNWSGFDLSHVCMIAADMALQGHEQMIVRCLDTNHVVPLGNICSYETARVAVSEVLGSRCRAKVIRPEVECEAVYRFIVVDGAIVGSPTGYDNSSVRTLVQNVVALHPVYNPDAVIDVGIIDGKPSLQAISPVMAAAWNVDDAAVWQALKTAQMRRLEENARTSTAYLLEELSSDR